MASPQETRLAQALAMLPGILVQLIEVLDSFGSVVDQLTPEEEQALSVFVEGCILLGLSAPDLLATVPSLAPANVH